MRNPIAVEVSRIDHYAQGRREGELSLPRTAKVHAGQSCARLQSVPGLGQILALVLRSESQDIPRFPRGQDFVSSCRLGKGATESTGQRFGASGKTIGHVPLRWAFAEAAGLFLRQTHPGKDYVAQLAHQHGTAKALPRLAHKLGRAVYSMLSRAQPFDLHRVVSAYPLRGAREPAASLADHGESRRAIPSCSTAGTGPA